MSVATIFVCLILFHLVFFLRSAYSKCPDSFHCGELGTLVFPFSDMKQPDCGLFMINCSVPYPTIELVNGKKQYEVVQKLSTNTLLIKDPFLEQELKGKSCPSFRNLSLPEDSNFTSFSFTPNLTLYICLLSSHETTLKLFESYRNYKDCPDYTVYYRAPESGGNPIDENEVPQECSVIVMPCQAGPDFNTIPLFEALSAQFYVELKVSDECLACHREGGKCRSERKDQFICQKGNSHTKIILATALSVSAALVLFLVLFIIWQRKKRIRDLSLLSKTISSDPSSKSDIEGGSLIFGIPIFSYTELEEATNNFDPSEELGDGGFGTVYYGKLKDGREVAIKRLYEHNYKRVEQFMNEIKILTTLKHPNLVTLYGCTSRRSRELLLVYEFIINGTVADHLHGHRASDSPLTWVRRMNIAIETANALTYLHKSDIIHRDVKTNNILLDEKFCVKVADFGLSRLFPNDVTHISTAPQGTPGYVDPEYHQCYQLTDKSDVYSFGVVLVELISSMPAVDITRHRHEINLANLALNKIQLCAFDELIDKNIGYGSDGEVTRMTTSVAELAFRCLQLEKELRPSMDEVLDFLKGIQGGDEFKFGKIKDSNGNFIARGNEVYSPEKEDALLLKNKNVQSPCIVSEEWVSSSGDNTSSME